MNVSITDGSNTPWHGTDTSIAISNSLTQSTIPLDTCERTPDSCPDWARCINNPNYACTQIEEYDVSEL